MELRQVLLLVALLLSFPGAGNAQQTQSTVNPNVPPVDFFVEQSGPQFRDNFQRAINDINVLFGRIGTSTARTRLTAPLTLFASFASGADVAGCGLAAGASACKTLQYLFSFVLVSNYDTAGNTVTLSFDSNDTTCLNITRQWTGGGPVTISGPGGSPPSIGLNCVGTGIVVNAPLSATLNLTNFKITSSGGSSVIIFQPGTVNIGSNMNIGAANAGVPQLQASGTGAQIDCNGTGYTISGGAGYHYQATVGGLIACGSPITLIGTPSFTFFAEAFGASNLLSTGVITGSATGQRYLAIGNGFIFTNGCAANYFPGSTPGAVSSGGQCL